MLSAEALLSSLHQKGVKVWEDNGRVCYQAPTGGLLSEDLSELRRLKIEILDLLRVSKPILYSPIQPRETDCEVPLTTLQAGLWKLKQAQSRSGSQFPNCVIAMRIRGTLDTTLLDRCISAVVQRHESLRTRIITVNGRPQQKVLASSEYAFDVNDLSHVDPDGMETEVTALGQRFAQETTDASVGPLFRARLFRLSKTHHVFFLVTDHIVSDGTSKQIVAAEIWALYDRFLRGLPFSLDNKPIQFADYAVWQERTLRAWLAEHETYWINRLRGAPTPQLPIDRSIKVIDPADLVVKRLYFGEETTNRLRALAQRERSLLSTVVLGIYILAMARWCRQLDVVVEVVSDGRIRPELERITGYLATSLVLRVQVQPTDSILQLLKRAQAELYAACEHYYPGALSSLFPEFRALAWFNWMPDNAECSRSWQWAEQIETISVGPYPFVQQVRAPLWPMFYYTDRDVNMTIQYCKSVVSTDSVEQLSKYVHTFAHEFARDPNAPVASVLSLFP